MKNPSKIKRLKAIVSDIDSSTEELICRRLGENYSEARLFGYREGNVYLSQEGTIIFDCPPLWRAGSRGGASYRWDRSEKFSVSLRLFTLRRDIPITFFDNILREIPHKNEYLEDIK